MGLLRAGGRGRPGEDRPRQGRALAELLTRLDALPKAPAKQPKPLFDWTPRHAQEALSREPYTPHPAEDVELPPFEFYTPPPAVEVPSLDEFERIVEREPLVRLRYRRCPACGEACHAWTHGAKPHGPNGCTGDGTDWTTWPDAPHPDGPRVDRWRHEKGSVSTGARGTP